MKVTKAHPTWATTKAPTKTYRKVKLKTLQVDPDVQRYFDPKWAAKLASIWQDSEVGTPVVSQRDDGSEWSVDGQHRTKIILDSTPDAEIYCEVWTGLSKMGEARKFLALNRNRKAPSAYDEFRVGLTAGEPTEIKMQEQAASCGLSFGHSGSNSVVSAIAACRRIVVKDKAKTGLLIQTFQAAEAAWGRAADSWDGLVIQAIAAVIHRNPTIDHKRLAMVLSKMPVGRWKADSVMGVAGGGGSVSRSTTMSHNIVAEYNKRIKVASKIK